MCHSRHYYRQAPSRLEEHAPRRDPGLRVSDQEREAAVTLLREHGAAGRLDMEELEQRVGAAYEARTQGELEALFRDLPGSLRAARPRAPAPSRHARFGHEWAAFLQVSFVLIAIWALSGAGYFWPAWVLVWWAVPLALRSGPRMLGLRPRTRLLRLR
jgi:hypothetical protein